MINIDKTIKDKMPQFFKRMEKGIICQYVGTGFARNLSTEMSVKIKDVQDKYDVKDIIAVITGTYDDNGDIVNMTTYVYTNNTCKPSLSKEKYCDDIVIFNSYIVNNSTNEGFFRKVGLTERNGLIRRRF